MNINLYFKFKTSSINIFVLKIDILFFTSKTLADILTELSDKVGGGEWGRSSRPWDKGRGRLQKNFFWALRASFWSKNKGGPGPPSPSPGSASD